MEEFDSKSYIRDDVKIEVKRRADEQVGAIKEKMNKWANKIVVGGFNPAKVEEHKEGDEWEDEDGKLWEFKHGIKQSIRKIQGSILPFWCPRCGMSLHHKLHDKFYKLRGACHNCVVSYEGKMRVDGVWEIYERKTMRRNEIAFLNDNISHHEDYIRTFKVPQVHFENGGWEHLATLKSFEAKFDEMRTDIDFMKNRIKQIQKEECEDDYTKLDAWICEHPWETWKSPEPHNSKR